MDVTAGSCNIAAVLVLTSYAPYSKFLVFLLDPRPSRLADVRVGCNAATYSTYANR